jgi:diguanylate cyclase (GGDEF)-like protein
MRSSSAAAQPVVVPPGDQESQRLVILTEIARIATEGLDLRPMLQRITDALAEKIGWEFVALIRIDQDPARFTCEAMTTTLPTAVHPGYGRMLGSGVVGEVALSGRPILLDDVRTYPNFVETLPGTCSEVCVPVRHRGRVVAILNAESPRPAAFHGQLPLVEAIAEQVAGAVASARLYEEMKRRAESLEILSEVSRTALQSGDPSHLLDRIVRYVQERFGFSVVAIGLTNESGTEVEDRAFAARPGLELRLHESCPITAGVVGRTIRTGEPQLVLDVRSDPDYFANAEEVVAEYSVPIRFQDRVLGALNLESDNPDVFDAGDLAVLRMIADQVAGAIHLAALNQRLSAATRELEETNRQLQEANRELEKLSLHDALTGVANRRHFDEALAAEWRRASRTGEPISLLLIDVDSFKAFNDTYGHPRGDAVLCTVADTLRAGAQRASDLMARYGGEEFALLLPGLGPEAARDRAEALRASVEKLEISHQRSVTGPWLTVSVGTATMNPEPGPSPARLVAEADLALYAAKAAGRNRVSPG